MIYELEPGEYGKASSLFEGLAYQLITTAVLGGVSPGRIWVDDAAQPEVAFMASPEGCFLAGYEGNLAFNRAVHETIVRPFLDRYGDVVLVCHPDAWESALSVVVGGRPLVKKRRMHYLLDRPRVNWKEHLLAGFEIEPIDGALLARPGLSVPEHVLDWMRSNWGSVAGFVDHGLGCAMLHGDRIVSWSLADCIVGDACEIGIHTAEAYRRQGLATLTVAATVAECLARGLTTVGWHCDVDNLGSRGVAEHVGFRHERDYVHHWCFAKEHQNV